MKDEEDSFLEDKCLNNFSPERQISQHIWLNLSIFSYCFLNVFNVSYYEIMAIYNIMKYFLMSQIPSLSDCRNGLLSSCEGFIFQR